MIDTIVIRIHNISEKERLIARLLKTTSGFNRETVDISEREYGRYTMLKNASLVGLGKNMTSHRNRLYVKSSSYYLNYLIDMDRNFIEFNFSIPKYKYGTNVVQFVQHFTARDFMITRNSGFNFNLNSTFKRLHSFLKKFFDLELDEDLEAWRQDVEIHRFDLCFNQVFIDKQEALAYLRHQKGIKQHYERMEGKKHQYDTSIYLPGRYFTCKIYHKGSEFHAGGGDATNLNRMNKKLKYKRFDIDKIGNFADRILRYEIEFKNTGLNYLYKSYIFRKNDLVFKKLKKANKRVETAWKKKDSVKLYENEDSLKIRNHKDWRIWERDSELYKQMVSQSSQFMLGVDRDSQLSSIKDIASEYNDSHTKVRVLKRALFSEDLLELCFDKFKKFFKKNQLGARVSISNLQREIDTYNARMKMLKGYGEKGSPKRISAIQKYLTYAQTYSEKVMIANKMYSRQAIYNMKKSLKELGYKEVPITAFDYKHDNTFEKYHNFMIDTNLCKR